MNGVLSKKFSILFLFILFLISLFFISLALPAAEKKAFWLDEQYVLDHLKEDSYAKLIVKGPVGQYSATPLDYIVLKFMDQIKESVGLFGLVPTQYYRLYTIFYALLSGFLGAWLVFLRIRRNSRGGCLIYWQAGVVVAALAVYYFYPMNLYYAIETRPYALWHSLWFLGLVLVMIDQMRGALVAVLAAMGATMTSALFQIFSLATGFFGTYWSLGREQGGTFGDIFWRAFKLFSLPTVVVFYYLLQQIPSGDWDNVRTLTTFFHYWIEHPMVPILSLIALYMTWGKKEYAGHTIVFMAVLFLYFLAPLTIYLTMTRHIYFAPRQYIYLNVIYPLFLIHLALMLPEYFGDQKTPLFRFPPWAYAVLAVLCIGLYSLQYVLYDYGPGPIKLYRLNGSMPQEYQSLVKAVELGGKVDPKVIKPYLQYYDFVVRYMPERADGYGMRGFCYYQLGQKARAISSYEKALLVLPDFFWYHLNLATIYYNEKEYGKALEHLDAAMKSNLREALGFVMASRQVYMPIRLTQEQLYGHSLKAQVVDGQRQMARLLVLSHFHLKQYSQLQNYAQVAMKAGLDEAGFFRYYAGIASLFLNAPKEAVSYLSGVISEYPDMAEAYHYLGLASKALAQDDVAREMERRYEAVKRMNSSSAWDQRQIPLAIY